MAIIDPVWAENGDKTPAPSDEKIDVGFVGGDRPTIEYLNFILNRVEAAANIAQGMSAAASIANLYIATAPADTDMNMFNYHPGIGSGSGTWLVGTRGDNPSLVWYSDNNGVSWNGGGNMGSQVQGAAAAIDATRFLHGVDGATQIVYSTDGIAWTNDAGPASSAPVAATGDVMSIVTKYPDSVFCMAGTSDGDIAIAAAGVANDGTYVSPGTPPACTAAGDGVNGLVWDTSSTFIALDDTGETYISVDGAGDVWATTTQAPVDVASTTTTFYTMAYNSDDTTLCVGGTGGSGVPEILRSDDNGVTWEVADCTNIKQEDDVRQIKYLGGRIWVSAGLNYDTCIFISFDNGATWHDGIVHRDTSPAGGLTISFNGEMIMVCFGTEVFISNTVPGLSNL